MLSNEKIERMSDRQFLCAGIKKQMLSCIVNEGYRCGIYVANISRVTTVAEILKYLIKEEVLDNNSFERYLSNDRPFRVSKNSAELYFDNGSIIRVKVANENIRAMRVNDVIVDYDVDETLVDVVIRKMYVPYKLLDEKRKDRIYKFVEIKF